MCQYSHACTVRLLIIELSLAEKRVSTGALDALLYQSPWSNRKIERTDELSVDNRRHLCRLLI